MRLHPLAFSPPVAAVRGSSPAQPLASIFSDRDDLTPLGNPFTPNPDDDGRFPFHAIGGAYRVRIFAAGGFEAIWRYVGIGTIGETDTGLLPITTPNAWLFDAATADADPGSGLFQLNNANPALATAAYIDNNNAGGADVSAWLNALDDSGDSSNRGLLSIFEPNDPTGIFRTYIVSGSVVDGTGYRKLMLAHVAGAGSFAAGGRYAFAFYALGATGEVPSSRTLTAGAGLTGGGTLATDRSFDVGAGTGILANANDVAIDKASDANVRAAASNKVLTGDLLESAAAAVTLTDAATIALDWDSGVNFQVTLTTNRVLGNPTNGQLGTWRTVLVKSDGGPDTLTFGNQYGGEVPTIDDVTTTQFYLLMIFCKTSSQFLVSAIDGSDA